MVRIIFQCELHQVPLSDRHLQPEVTFFRAPHKISTLNHQFRFWLYVCGQQFPIFNAAFPSQHPPEHSHTCFGKSNATNTCKRHSWHGNEIMDSQEYVSEVRYSSLAAVECMSILIHTVHAYRKGIGCGTSSIVLNELLVVIPGYLTIQAPNGPMFLALVRACSSAHAFACTFVCVALIPMWLCARPQLLGNPISIMLIWWKLVSKVTFWAVINKTIHKFTLSHLQSR